ncbi:protein DETOXIFICATION 45, chloroplastic isoform X2 [Capsicum annuum]|uniref:protein DETOXIFICATION 45, chloroplastic isoform X2 n=1 Tax=Capsicum annuum TaxID=4072 RepID=UPI001FB117DE|nr:protein DETOXIFICATION 45, chloroplastic isoform X2 [Capsicum annuum]
MAAAQLTSKVMHNGYTELKVKQEISKICSLRYSRQLCNSFSRISQNSLKYVYSSNNCSLSIGESERFLSSPVIFPRKRKSLRFHNKFSSESGVEASDLQDTTAAQEIDDLSSSSGKVVFSELNEPVPIVKDVDSESIEETPTSSPQSEDVKRELVMLSLPAIAGQAIDPLVQLMETAYIGRLGKTSSMRVPAKRFLALRALGAPAFVVSLALQGIFRGFKDTKTPVFCLGIGNLVAVILFPLLMYHFGLGVSGAAISTVISQYTVAFSMIWYLNQRVMILPPRFEELQFGGYLKSGGFLIGRTLSVLFTMTLATSMAARQGAVVMAAHQICLQVWLAVSLLTDALAASAQALIASYLSKGDYVVATEITHYVLKIGLVAGVFLAAALGVSFGSLSTLFTKDAEVLGVVSTGLLFVSASQPINALAFIFDGLHYGVSDFAYAARSMMLVGAISSSFLLCAPRLLGLPGVWLGLTLFMGLRMMAGVIRLLSKKSPWWFLHCDTNEAKVIS